MAAQHTTVCLDISGDVPGSDTLVHIPQKTLLWIHNILHLPPALPTESVSADYPADPLILVGSLTLSCHVFIVVLPKLRSATEV